MDSTIKPGMMKYCVIGNVVKEHFDEDGNIKYGTASFPGGRKVYITRRLWGNEVVVMGLNRFKSKYVYEKVPLAWIENIRFSRTFDPGIMKLMSNNDEFPDTWWSYKEEDRVGAEEYAQILNRVKAGDKAALDQYNQDFMYRFYFGKRFRTL